MLDHTPPPPLAQLASLVPVPPGRVSPCRAGSVGAGPVASAAPVPRVLSLNATVFDRPSVPSSILTGACPNRPSLVVYWPQKVPVLSGLPSPLPMQAT